VDVSLEGEDLLRAEYLRTLDTRHQILSRIEPGLSGDAAALLEQSHELRSEILRLVPRIGNARAQVKQELARGLSVAKARLAEEEKALAAESEEIAQLSAQLRKVVGQMAFDSFRKVRSQFYELVLKSDVGLVDVAFTRKQDKTASIHTLATQKDSEVQALDREFRDILQDDED